MASVIRTDALQGKAAAGGSPLPGVRLPAAAKAAKMSPSVAPEVDALYELGDVRKLLASTEDDRLERSELEKLAHGPDMRPGSQYGQLLGDILLEVAALTVFCQAAMVNNRLYGDNEHSSPVVVDPTAVATRPRQPDERW